LAAHAVSADSAAQDDAKPSIALATAIPATVPVARPLERPAVALLAARSQHPAPVAVAPLPTVAAPHRNPNPPTATSAVAALPRGPAGRSLAVQLTAYSASEAEGTAGGLTASGARVRPGTVAVDPAVIPLGSKLRIEGLPGVYRAEDTGGGVRGAHVDVFMDSRGAALEFGRRASVRVEVLE
jgi:3D (Asp-Asp-Asp) domain-containing protein